MKGSLGPAVFNSDIYSIFTHELAIDLGTANTVIFKDDEVVLDEPSIIAVETKTGKLVAIGNEAQLIEEHTNPRIYTVRPLMNGVIADYDAAEMMLNGFIKKAIGKRRSLFKPALKIVIGIPGGGTAARQQAERQTGAYCKEPERIPCHSAAGFSEDAGKGRPLPSAAASCHQTDIVADYWSGSFVDAEAVKVEDFIEKCYLCTRKFSFAKLGGAESLHRI